MTKIDTKQSYSEVIRSHVVLILSSASTICCLGGMFASPPNLKPVFPLVGCSVTIIAHLTNRTLEEHQAILNDVTDISDASRTSQLAYDLTAIIKPDSNPVVAITPTAVDTSQELRRSMWLNAKESLAQGKTKLDVIKAWGYEGVRYPVGQAEWSKLELEFGAIDG